MPRFIVDFKDAVEIDRTPVPAGVYTCTIDASFAQEVTSSKSTGTPYITLGFRIIEGEHAGRMVFNRYMLAGKGAGFTKSLLKAFGFWSEAEGDRFLFDFGALDGAECRVVVSERTLPDGTPANEVKMVLPTAA